LLRLPRETSSAAHSLGDLAAEAGGGRARARRGAGGPPTPPPHHPQSPELYGGEGGGRTRGRQQRREQHNQGKLGAVRRISENPPDQAEKRGSKKAGVSLDDPLHFHESWRQGCLQALKRHVHNCAIYKGPYSGKTTESGWYKHPACRKFREGRAWPGRERLTCSRTKGSRIDVPDVLFLCRGWSQ